VLLPLMWAVNVWLFWPDFQHGHDPVIAKRAPMNLPLPSQALTAVTPRPSPPLWLGTGT